MRARLFQLRYRQWLWAPSVLISILALISFSLFVMLGQWQLDRAEVKRAISERYQSQLNQPYQSIKLNDTAQHEHRYKKIKLTGNYDNQRQMLLDNQIHNGLVGYHILIPFIISENQAVLVNRGWVSLGEGRDSLPVILPPRDTQQVMGVVTLPHKEGYRLGHVTMSDQWPQLIPYIDLEKIQSAFEYQLLPYVIWLAPEMDDYYVRDWKPIWSPAEKSEAYALQWFSFAFIVVVLYLSLNIKRTRTEEIDV